MALVGSRGDVQPGLALALELQRTGHHVAVGVAPNLVPMATRLGLSPVAVGTDSHDLLASDLVRREMRSTNPVRRHRALREVATAGWDSLCAGLLELSAGADVVVTGLLGQEVGSAVAERLDIGFAALHYCPVRANSVVPLTSLGAGSPAARRATWALGEQVRWQLTRAAENRLRARLGLRPARVQLPERLRERGALEIQAYDRALVPGLAEEWPRRRPLVGFLGLDARARGLLEDADPSTDPALDEWLDAGEAPVYVGFGSMPVSDPAGLVGAVEEACGDLGLRAVISSGWNDFPGRSGDRVRIVGAVDHAVVLPRCRVAVHHGGAGTVAATLRAGLPSVVGWYSADQPVWGRLLTELGVGTSLRAAGLDRRTLRGALESVLGDDTRQRAGSLGASMATPDQAVRRAARLLADAG